MNNTLKLVLQAVKDKKIDKVLGYELIKQFEKSSKAEHDKRIAIVGIGFRMPKCKENLDFWEMIKNGISAVGEVTKIRKKDIIRYFDESEIEKREFLIGSFLDRIDCFDYEFFGIPPKEAALLSPVQRIFLEVVIECINDAGYYGKIDSCGSVGTYVGYAEYLYENYGMMIHGHYKELLKADKLGNVSSMLLKRLYKFLGIEGPSMLIDTACSSSMTAVIEACDALKSGKVDVAISGGIRINNLPVFFHETNIGIESSDAYTRTFDDKADGTGVGEGVGFVMLKRLSDAVADNDRIYAVIDGYSISTESGGASLTAPTVYGQKKVILDAWNNSDVSPEDIGYIELHGTGTRLGDGIEFKALDEAFHERTEKCGFCAVGSAKSNFGHLHEAAGILSLIKCVYMLNYKFIPESLNFAIPNSEMDIVNSAIYVNSKCRKWENKKKFVIGINSFGLSGTNCHLLLEEYDDINLRSIDENKSYFFHEKRCWYSDYIPINNIQIYKYLWERCDEINFSSKDIIANKCIYICNRPDEEEYSLINELKNYANIKVCTYFDTMSVDFTGSDIIFSLLGTSDKNDEMYSRELLEQIFRIFLLLEKNDNYDFYVRLISKNVFSIDKSVNYDYKNSIYIGYIYTWAKEACFSNFISVDSDLENIELTASALLGEHEKYSAVRGKSIYERCFNSIIDTPVKRSVKSGQVWVIIGGSSGIGFECAKYLLQKEYVEAVAVIGRRSSDDVRDTISLLKNVHYYQTDVCKSFELEEAFTDIQSKFGKISGVINSAGIERDMLLSYRDPDDGIFFDVLAPKVIGNENIISSMKRFNVDEFILFSSIATIFPMIGQSDYVAANMYCEAMTDFYRNSGMNVRCLQWNTWSETGMAFRSNMKFDTIFNRLDSRQGMCIFADFLNNESNCTLSGTINDKIGKELMCNSGVKFNREILDQLGIKDFKTKRPEIRNNDASEYIMNPDSSVEENIFGVVNNFLGYDKFDHDESLFELGIDSVSFIKIQKQLSNFFNVELSVAEIVENCSISLLNKLINEKILSSNNHKECVDENNLSYNCDLNYDDIAIIGCAAMIPRCNSMDDIIDFLSYRSEFDSDIKEIRKNDIYNYLDARNIEKENICLVHGSLFDRIDLFDASFFGISPREAVYMSPVQRMSLENAYHAIENAGYSSRIRKTKTAVFTAYSLNPKDSYGSMIMELFPEEMTYAEFGNTISLTAGRISHYFDLDGPALNIDSACASSITAVDVAMNGLKTFEYDYAVVQGIKLDILPIKLRKDISVGTMSSDGKTRAFDENSDGYGIGEGIITLVLKRKKEAIRDHDHVYALLKGCAVNHNGNTRSIAAPSKTKQVELIRQVLKNSNVNVSDIDYVETHGTATVLGDNIEFEALKAVFEGNKKGKYSLGTLKSSIGHLSEASGMLSIYKLILMFHYNVIFPNAGMVIPNSQIDMIDSPFYLNDKLRKWSNDKKTALINCLGVNGTNSQLILQNFNSLSVINTEEKYIFVLSAKNVSSLKEYCNRFYSYLSSNLISPADLSFTLCAGKEIFDFRIAFSFSSINDVCKILEHICKYGFEKSGCYMNFDMDENNIRYAETVHSDNLYEEQCIAYVNDKVIYDKAGSNKEAFIIPVPLYPFKRKRFWLPLQKKLFYNIKWNNRGRLSDVILSDNNYSEHYIIISPENVYTDWLLQTDFNRCVNYSFYQINKSYIYKIEEIIINAVKYEHIHFVYVIPHSLEPNTLSELKQVQNNGIKLLNKFLNILIDIVKGRTTKLTIVTEKAVSICEGEEYYLNSTVHGLGMCISHEYPNIKCNLCDVDLLNNFAENFIQIVNQKINSFVGIRNGFFYVRTICEKEIPFAESKYEIKGDGVYLITGASGGIGSCIADYLVKSGVYGLVFIDSDRFKDVIPKNNIRIENIKRKCRFFRQYLFSVDDEVSLKCVFDDIKNSNIKLKGIFHCAGRADSGLMVNCTDEKYESVFSAKVYASWLIKKMTYDMPLDFILNFSSEVCTNGEAGMSVYTAGNFFMNEIANADFAKRRIMKSFMFTTWQEVGMGVRNHTNIDLIFKSMSNHQALKKIFQCLSLNDRGIIIGELNEEMLPQLTDKLQNVAFCLESKLADYLHNFCNEKRNYEMIGDIPEKSRSRLVYGSKITDVTLHGASSFTQLQQNVGKCYSRVLGYDEIDIYSSFFELGGDSILMTRLNLLINEIYPNSISLTDLYSYCTIYDLSLYLERKLRHKDKSEYCQEEQSGDSYDGVAIIGYSFNFPECNTDEELLEVLENGICTVKSASRKRKKLYDKSIKKYMTDAGESSEKLMYKNMSYLSDIDAFDYRFFGYNKDMADLMEPVLRLSIQNVYNAMQNAGYLYNDFLNMDKLYYLAYSAFSDYSEVIKRLKRKTNFPIYKNQASFICGEIADMFRFNEEATVIDTACSSALTAIHLAADKIKNTSKIAVISGVYTDVNIVLESARNVGYESTDGITRALDEYTTGSGESEGIASIIIKDLKKAREDGDFIHGVILSSVAMSNGYSNGITVPNQITEEEVIDEAWKKAGIDPNNLDYIELHGSGTPIGDLIEFNALKNVFEKYTKNKNFCGVGTIKNNIGHTFECAGLAGILKVLVMIKNHKIFTLPNLTMNNQKLELIDSAMYIGSNRSVEKKCMICGVSSFGISGMNCHAIIAEGDRIGKISDLKEFPHILKISAKTHKSLLMMLESLISVIRKSELLSHITYTLNTRRDDFNQRLFFVFSSKNELLEQMEQALYDDDGYSHENKIKLENYDELLKKLHDYRNCNFSDKQTELFIKKMYLLGVDIPWNEIYMDKFRVIPLPGYKFEKNECWI